LNHIIISSNPTQSSAKSTAATVTWGKQALSARGAQAGRKALRIRHTNGLGARKKARKKRPRGFE
jgi:hypothetical protein